jgi:DNA polymerase I
MSESPFNWDVVRAYYCECRSYKQVAERFGLKVEAVKKRAFRGQWGGPQSGSTTTEGTDQGTDVPSEGTNGTGRGTTSPASGHLGGTQGTPEGTSAAGFVPSRKVEGTEGTSFALSTPAIPADINSLSKLEAACFYHSRLGWAVHPLVPPDRGDPQERGKKPVLKGWRDFRAAEITPDFLTKYFANGSSHNLGCVVRAPYVHVDLDSKPDAGASVRAWLDSRPDLAAVPRERTGGGAHLVFLCRDLPEDVLRAKKAPVAKINEAVTAELYVDGLNIVLSPSVHKNGHTYSWEVTGPIPEVAWAELSAWFGFAAPEPKKRGRPAKEKPWWTKWKQDLRTLDLAAALGELGLLGECIDPDASKWAVRCPWESEHTGNPPGEPGSSTVIFNAPETLPAFHCLHAHCDGRELKDVLEMLEQAFPGIVARHCTGLREWLPGTRNAGGRPRVVLPGTGRSQSDFAGELGKNLASARLIYTHAENAVEVRFRLEGDAGGICGHYIHHVKPADLVTGVERVVETGVIVQNEAKEKIFMPKSMSEADARITLANRRFLESLPLVTRLLDVPVPFPAEDGGLLYPEPGYDPRFRTWLAPSAPRLRTMGLDEALDLLLGRLLANASEGGFWWRDQQSRCHALARLLTPFCRALMRWKRPPLWIFDGNREGSGKDTCANLTFILYTGHPLNGVPTGKDSEDELRKRITSSLISGARFFHLANIKNHIRYGCLEAATDNTGVWEDRLLGASQALFLRNETEFSLSANNATWEPDIERRSRQIRLHFPFEDVNAHRYAIPGITDWIVENRASLLSAVNALVMRWVREGCPPGPTPFTSFPEWARVVGGVLHACGLPDPCLPHEGSATSGDQGTRAMRSFFALAFAHFGDRRVPKQEFQDFVQDCKEVQDLFEWIDFASRRGLTTFGKLVVKYQGRVLGDISLHVEQTSKNWSHYRFFRDLPGTPGNPPTDPTSPGFPPASGTLWDCDLRCPTPQLPDPQGLWDIQGLVGHFPSSHRAENNSDEKKENRDGIYSPPSKPGGKCPTRPTSPTDSVVCTARADLDRVIDDLLLSSSDRIALDLETHGARKGDGLDPWRGEIRLLSVSREGGPVWMLDLMALGYDLGPLGQLLEAATVVAHNAKFDCLWLRVKCGLRIPKVFCTLTAARLLSAGIKPGNNLDQCLQRYLGIAPGPDQSRSDWGAMFLIDDQLAYAARDVAHLHELAGVLEVEIGKAGLENVWALEIALLPRVVEMEAAGIRVDVEKLNAISTKANTDATQASAELREALGNPGLNPASQPQLLSALRSAGLELESTAEAALKEADDGRIVPLVLAHREAIKRAQQAESLLAHVQADGRIHARFEPTGTATGRFSSKDPNLQNIGRGELRSAFVPEPGHKFVVADYSQVELRAAAAIAGETRMIDAYRAGADLHKLTASVVLGKPESEVTKEDRQKSKSANFGLCYGQSAPGLVRYAAAAYGIALDEAEAREIRAAFFRTYGHLRQWHGLSHQKAEKGVTEVRTRLGRRRLIPETASDWERFTALVNTPVQGGCADGMKQALVLLAERLPEGTRILSTVHDELIVEVPEALADAVRELVAATMRDAMQALFPEVPIEVDTGTCNHWGEK